MDTKERARIESAGGFVEFNRSLVSSDKIPNYENRVNGNLALSRAMGDFVFKMNDKLGQVFCCNYPISHSIDFFAGRSNCDLQP